MGSETEENHIIEILQYGSSNAFPPLPDPKAFTLSDTARSFYPLALASIRMLCTQCLSYLMSRLDLLGFLLELLDLLLGVLACLGPIRLDGALTITSKLLLPACLALLLLAQLLLLLLLDLFGAVFGVKGGLLASRTGYRLRESCALDKGNRSTAGRKGTDSRHGWFCCWRKGSEVLWL